METPAIRFAVGWIAKFLGRRGQLWELQWQDKWLGLRSFINYCHLKADDEQD